LEPARVTTCSQLLLELATALSAPRDALREAEESLDRESRINEFVQEIKTARRAAGDDPERPTYPLEKESILLSQIRSGEITGAQKTLNELLSHVFFSAGQRMPQIQMRARELIVLLSRAVLTEGADPEEVFGLNYQFVDAIDHQDDINGVAYWMARIVRRFADLILYLPHLDHARALRRALTFVHANSARALRVADAAEAAGMSESHFSRVFRSEIGETFVRYLNRIRCERATEMLRSGELPIQEIAHRCGFSDHSYFTKVYRSITGAAPSVERRR
ncbi:MAG: helix-turn-helix domain-containing protein, partial [Spirochaetota bacterium]